MHVKLESEKERLKIFSYSYHSFKTCIVRRLDPTLATTFGTSHVPSSNWPDQILYRSFCLAVRQDYIPQPSLKSTWDTEIKISTWYDYNKEKYLPHP